MSGNGTATQQSDSGSSTITVELKPKASFYRFELACSGKKSGLTDLMMASLIGDEREVSRLIDSGADVNATYDNLSALTLATMRGHTAVVMALAENGASIEEIRDALKTAIHENHTEIIELLEQKAKLN